jgi:predicted dehydrogenase
VFQKDPALRVGAICDVYEPNLENGVSVASKVPGNHPKQYRNYKELLADKDIHAVLIATPEHWHAQMVLDALAAGKDVYVEKPLCQTPEEGAQLVEAERKSKNIIQVGMQRRSYDLYLEGRDLVKAGKLGNVRMVRSWEARRPPSWMESSIGSSGKGPPCIVRSMQTAFATGDSTRITPAASWLTRGRMYSMEFIS